MNVGRVPVYARSNDLAELSDVLVSKAVKVRAKSKHKPKSNWISPR